MRKYTVRFNYNNDTRFEVDVDAYNDLMALAIAFNELAEAEWVKDNDGFNIKIIKRG
jgi:hypothetical protein